MIEVSGSIEYFPALKCKVGKWVYYLTSMPFSEVASRVKKLPRRVDNRQLHVLLQRELRDERLRQIARYLATVEERFLNAVVIGVEGGDPHWLPVDISDTGQYGPLPIDRNVFKDFLGVLQLDRTERMFTIDGQHRVEGIKLALKDHPELGSEMLPVIFVAHLPTDSGLERTRRLFSTLNRYAVRVSQGDIVLLNEDDGYAIATRQLVREHWGLNRVSDPEVDDPLWLVEPATNVQLAPNNVHSFSTIVSLYNQAVIFYPARGRRRTDLKTVRPEPDVLDDIYTHVSRYWDTVAEYCDPVKEAFTSVPGDGTVAKHRGPDGGHLLFRPAGQAAFCEAVRVMMFRRVNLSEAIGKLSQVSLDLSSQPWRGVLWDGSTMMSAKARLNRNLLLHMVGEPPDPDRGVKDYSVEAEYRKAINDENASLSDLVKFPRVGRRKIIGLNG